MTGAARLEPEGLLTIEHISAPKIGRSASSRLSADHPVSQTAEQIDRGVAPYVLAALAKVPKLSAKTPARIEIGDVLSQLKSSPEYEALHGSGNWSKHWKVRGPMSRKTDDTFARAIKEKLDERSPQFRHDVRFVPGFRSTTLEISAELLPSRELENILRASGHGQRPFNPED